MTALRPRVAVVANINARSVTPAIIKDIKELVPKEELFVPSSAKEGAAAAEQIMKDDYDVVMCAGGDGTFARVITDIMECANGKKIPAFGVIRLGTGNGVAEALKVAAYTKENLLKELEQARNPDARIPISVLRIDKKFAPFAGTGMDANILRDYTLVRKFLNNVPFLPENLRGRADYVIAILTLSFWRYALQKFPEVVIRNGGACAWQIDFHGKRVGKPLSPGEIIYKGPVSFAACSTVPYYGFDVPFFPQVFTLFGDYFQLRFTAMNILDLLDVEHSFKNIRDIFNGRLAHPKLWDFACKEVIIETDGLLFQIGGDSVGRHKKMRINSAKIVAVQGSAAAAPEPPTK